jgi:hypothetical protein
MNKEKLQDLLASGENISILADFFLSHPIQIEQLMDIALKVEGKGSWRAIWVADRVHEKEPELIKPYIPRMVDALENMVDESKLRHLLKLISLNDIPSEKISMLLDFCLREFTDAERPVAIRVHAMQILYEISELEPDFKDELAQVIEHEMEYHGSAGISSRGKMILKKLSKTI